MTYSELVTIGKLLKRNFEESQQGKDYSCFVALKYLYDDNIASLFTEYEFSCNWENKESFVDFLNDITK